MSTENFANGWIKLFRSLMDKGWYRDSEYVHLWVHLMMRANHSENQWLYKNQTFIVKRGQFVTSRLSLSRETGIQESKVERILKCFQSEQQIKQENLYTSRLISICNYEQYQMSEQQDEQPVNSERTASEQRVNTNKEFKNERMEEVKGIISSPDGNGEPEPEPSDKAEYTALKTKDVKTVSEFIKAKKPKHYQPYMDLWNLFCEKHGTSKIQTMSDTRKRKLRTRLSQKNFDFVAILSAATKNTYALQNKWFGFDFLIENDNNFVKVLEMKYVNSGAPADKASSTNSIDLSNR